jgi:predicted metal-dependent enzyme (double-stranded beta helix superfamily)
MANTSVLVPSRPRPRLERAYLLELAAHLAATTDPACLPPAVAGSPAPGRRYARILSEPYVEAWLIEWSTGSGIDLHDHGGASGALHVVRGALLEAHADRFYPGPLRYRQVRRGGAITFGPATVHDVVNMGTETALSVHVYSPTLETMTFYDHQADRVPVPRHTELVTDPA